MDQIKNILIAVDFSDCSKSALEQAVRVAGWNGARLHAVHVIDPSLVGDLAETMNATKFDASSLLHRQAHDKLTTWINKAGGKAEAIVVVGTPIHELLSKVKEVSADLLVAGARGFSPPIIGVGTLVTKLTRKAPINVLLVSEDGAPSFHKIVVCVDFSPTSALAIEQAAHVANRESGEIHCLHVFDPPWRRFHFLAPAPEVSEGFQKQYSQTLQLRLEQFVGQHKDVNLRCVLFPWSSYGQGIAQYAREVTADLVILGTLGHTNLRYILMGSTAERVLRELPCSVLAVPPPDSENILSKPEQ